MGKRASKGGAMQAMFRDPSGQEHMFEKSLQEELEQEANRAVECFGQTFPSDAARREHFLQLLADKLKQPEFRKTEGFPMASDEDILALSDPPFYTACPNPFIADFIRHYGKPYVPTEHYSREPFAADVSEGKNDPIYNAHTYHTKVPHKAIMRYILHYTDPGDLVLDFFCGTGMTAVAAQECARAGEVAYESLGMGSAAGSRYAVASDLSPMAGQIAQSYTRRINMRAFEDLATKLLNESEAEFGWMFETDHTGWPAASTDPKSWHNGRSSTTKKVGHVNFYVWSERFVCPDCSGEFSLWSAAVDPLTAEIAETFSCPACGTKTTKRSLSRAMETIMDPILNRPIKRVKRDLVRINYTFNGSRFEKNPDAHDFEILQQINALRFQVPCPANEMPNGERRLKDGYDSIGITHVHHLHFARTLHVLADLWQRIQRTDAQIQPLLRLLFTSQLINISVLNRFRRVSFPYNPMSGTLYIGSLVSEANPYQAYRNKIHRFVLAKAGRANSPVAVSVQSATSLPQVPDNSIDYIFIDPPFGRNLHYSELNFLWEAWLRVLTNREPEAVMDRGRDRELYEYQSLMQDCFREAYRILKPGRWMTVEFHNSSNAVWNAIQESVLASGFMIADIRVLDKQAETFKQSQQGLVKADLIISAYKPNDGLEDRFKIEAGTEEGAWDFVRTHLRQLPAFVPKGKNLESVAERQNFMLFDRMVAFHIQRGVSVPISAAEFYGGLHQRFIERDSMFFLPEQAADYDRKRATVDAVEQLQLIPRDEESAIRWLRQELKEKPRTFQDISPQFMREIGGWLKFEKPIELRDLLEQNFLHYDGKVEVPSQIHAYLSSNFKDLRKVKSDDAHLRAKAADRWYVPDPNKLADLEKLREKELLKEFAEYQQSKPKKLKMFRLEAVRAGFKSAYDRQDYKIIVEMAQKLPEIVLQEDEKLLMYYDVASTRLSDEGKDKLFQ